jgi:Alpha/beta hydrolase domain
MPELTVPLGTYQGWNPRCDACGASNFLQPFNVSFWPFPLTEAERGANGDPRPFIEARYAKKADYVAKVTAAVQQLREHAAGQRRPRLNRRQKRMLTVVTRGRRSGGTGGDGGSEKG